MKWRYFANYRWSLLFLFLGLDAFVPKNNARITGGTFRMGGPEAYAEHVSVRFDSYDPLQSCVFCFGLFEDWNVGVSVFPQRKKIAVLLAGAAEITHHDFGSGQL